jgi:hypothetical protein
MKARACGFVAVLGLLTLGVRADDSSAAGTPPPPTDVRREVLKGYVYQAATPAKLDVPVIMAKAPAPNTETDDSVVRLPTLQVNGKPDQTYQELNDAVAEANLSVPCDLFVRNTAKFQYRALGPPLPPMSNETPSERLPAQFPLVTLAW